MSDPAFVDAIGFAAASLVLATFSMRSMIALRWVAIASNLAFIAYGYLGSLAPILLLHVLLLPINVYRLAQLRQRPTGTAGCGTRPRMSRSLPSGAARPEGARGLQNAPRPGRGAARSTCEAVHRRPGTPASFSNQVS
jgi:hypothetical protein